MNETPVFRSLEYIEARIQEKLTVGMIAGSVYFSRFHYQRLFREIVGDSVMEYVTKRKLSLAGGELLGTGATVLDIALKYGYDSHEGFSRSFKAYMGVTPTEYRKYGLAAISQKTVKERLNMTYSKTTDEIIRELNDFIAKAKETAALARKCEVPAYVPFWSLIADSTGELADRTKPVLERISAIAENPDEITGMFDIVKVLDDVAFQTNLLAFNAKLTIERAQPEHRTLMNPLCIKYRDLCGASVMKAKKITEFFNELSSLIIEDMRKTAARKIRVAAEKGAAAMERITGYGYIRMEVSHVVDRLTKTPVAELTAPQLDDLIFQLNIIAFAGDVDVIRNPQDKAQFEGLTAFKESLWEAHGFFKTLITPENTPAMIMTSKKLLSDIGFQGNILLFHIRGEVEKLNLAKLLDDRQKAAFDRICGDIDSFNRFAQDVDDESAYKPASEKLHAVHAAIAEEADKLGDKGGAVRFIGGEFKGLADHLARLSR